MDIHGLIYKDSVPFMTMLLEELEKTGIHLTSPQVDHICYRVETTDEYLKLRNSLLPHSMLLSDNQIGGRPISVFKLLKPITYQHHTISVFELPAPSPNKPYSRGYQHIEIVIPYTLEKFMEENPDIHFHTKGMSKAINKDIKLTLPSGVVKFHEMSLEEVIEIENNNS